MSSATNAFSTSSTLKVLPVRSLVQPLRNIRGDWGHALYTVHMFHIQHTVALVLSRIVAFSPLYIYCTTILLLCEAVYA